MPDIFLNVPNLRFPGFSGEWECKQVKDVAPLQRGFDLPSQSLKEGIYPVVYSNGVMNYHSEYKCEAPGLVTGRSGTIGKLTYIENGKYWPHNTTLWVTDFNNNDSKFIYYFYEHLDLSRFSSGSGVPTLNRNDVHAHNACIPSLLEQKKIASFLSLLDTRISIHSKVIERYESLIKALYQYVMTKIRGESIRLGEIVYIQKGKQINGECLSNMGPYYVMNGGITPSGYYSQFNTEANTISISEGGNSCGYVKYNEKPYWSGGHCYSLLNASPFVDYRFLFHTLKYHQDDIMALRIGSGLPNIQKKDIESFQIILPSMDEQKRCASFFDALSFRLNIAEQVRANYETQKKYLILNLFV